MTEHGEGRIAWARLIGTSRARTSKRQKKSGDTDPTAALCLAVVERRAVRPEVAKIESIGSIGSILFAFWRSPNHKVFNQNHNNDS